MIVLYIFLVWEKATIKYTNFSEDYMDLLEYVAMQMKKGKKPSEIRQLLVQNGYPVYEVENALAVSEPDEKDDAKGKKSPLKVSLKLNAPGYVVILALSITLMVVGVATLVFYLI